MLLRIILVLKDERLETFFRGHFAQSDLRVESFGRLKNPFQKAVRTSGDIFVIETRLMPKPIESAIALLNDLPENPTSILLSDNDTSKGQADLLASGADVVLYSGLSKKTLLEAVDATVDARSQLAKKPWLNERTPRETRISSFISESSNMKIFMEMLQKVIPCNTPVLLLGETGVGKEHLAKIIHYEGGSRAQGPFVAVNCGALPENLLESELFGHEKGAFTGAIRSRRGAFEMAHGGTIFLDEIGELPPHMQVKLLRVLQEYEVSPVGSEKSMWVDVRVIAATNRDIERSIEEGTFRQDLYYRLSVFTLSVPPLRERQEDISHLAKRYLADLAGKLNKEVHGITEEALQALMQYTWPGNVRELINVLERAVILCQGHTITPRDLPENICAPTPDRGLPESLARIITSEWRNKTLPEIRADLLEMVERSYFQLVLTETGGRVGAAAEKAGIHPRGLFNKMKQYGLRKEDFKLGKR
jgi:two-component system response regulator AtoC